MKRHIYISKIFLFIFYISFLSTVNGQNRGNRPYIPVQKNIDSSFVKSIFNKGKTKVYADKELPLIAMPCSGIGSGEVNITGEGNICFHPSIMNGWEPSNGGGNNGYSTGYHYLNPIKDKSIILNNFYIKIKGKQNRIYKLNSDDFDDMSFIGEYPIATIDYKMKNNQIPLKINSEVFSPFIPLDVRSSANPVTIVKFTITNKSNKTMDVSLAGWLKQNQFSKDSNIRYINEGINNKKVKGCMLGIQSNDSITKKSNFGNLSLAVFDKKAKVYYNSCNNDEFVNDLLNDYNPNLIEKFSKTPQGCGISSSISIKPNETKNVTFVLSWYFPNKYESAFNIGYVGRIYDNWYNSSSDVVGYVSDNYERLYKETKSFNKTYFDTTLPYWLANRMTMSVSTLASGNITLWKNGRMYAYEGVGFCNGTCGHVYNFVTAISHLFPSLERSVRTMQDFNDSVGFSKSGRINYRGHDANKPDASHGFASDAQSGYVLKAYREHLMSKDGEFLKSIWDKVKMAMGYSIFKDGAEIGLEPNGVLECKQTFWDPMWFGPNPYNNTLYLAALRAAEEMAKYMNEPALASRYHDIFSKGEEYMNKNMWNGKYYIHLYPIGFSSWSGNEDNGFRSCDEIESEAIGYVKDFNEGKDYYYKGDACDANQLFGQNWAHQLNLGYILPASRCKEVGKSIFKYNWTPDIATVYNYEKPKHRVLADSGEAGMINGAWPNDVPKDFENTHDKSDTWTGLEYEAACDIINEGLLKEGFIVLKSVDDRYNALKRNPWNEIEGADHYSRAMHAWNVLLSLSGFFSNGPENIISFVPKINKSNFKSFFSSACGWGNVERKEDSISIINKLNLVYGNLSIKTLRVLASVGSLNKENIKVTINNKPIQFSCIENGDLLEINFPDVITIKKGNQLNVEITK